MKERPILFNDDLWPAIADGRKTQTRRLIDPQPRKASPQDLGEFPGLYRDGDWLWRHPGTTGCHRVSCRPEGPDGWNKYCPHGSAGDTTIALNAESKAEESLIITGVRVERLQDISEEDAKAEGAQPAFSYPGWDRVASSPSYRWGFHKLWQSIYGPESWGANPWVWVIEFKRLEREAVPCK